MKTNRLKNQLKLGILLFGTVLLFFRCESEHFEQQKTNSGFIVKKVYAKDISNNRLLNETLNKIQKFKPNNVSHRTVYNNEHNFYVETDQATYIENGEYHSYTFLIYRDSQTNLTENLLLSLQPDLTYKAFIVSYDFTEAEKQMVANGDYVSLTDKTTFTPLENFDTDEITNELSREIYYNAALGYCYELVEETSQGTGWTILVEKEVPCPEDGEPNDTEIDAGDSSTGGGTGTDNGFPDPSDDGSSSGGGTSDSSSSTSDDSSNPPDDGEDCLLDSNGNCIGNATKPEVKPEETPCPGDPIPNPEVAGQKGNSGTKGALYGCTRYGGSCTSSDGRTKSHDGIDIKNDYGEPIYAMYSGFIYSTKYDPDGAGYYTRIQSTVNGETFLVEYFHLQEDNRILQTSNPLTYVNAGDIIGYQGDSGNLKSAIKKGTVDSHVHIEVRVHDGSNQWGYSNFILVDPRDYLNTTINDDGTSEENIDCN